MIYLTELVSADKYNEFAFFYQNKVSNIRCYILVIYPALPHILMKSQFSPVISKDLEEILHQLKSWISLLHLIPTKVFKSVSHCLTNHLENI